MIRSVPPNSYAYCVLLIHVIASFYTLCNIWIKGILLKRLNMNPVNWFLFFLSLSYDCPEWRKCAGSLLPLWSNIRSAGVPVSVYWLCRTLQCPFLFHLTCCKQLPRVLPDLCWMVGVKGLVHQPQFTLSAMVNRYMQVLVTWRILIYTWLELWTRFLSHKGVRVCV